MTFPKKIHLVNFKRDIKTSMQHSKYNQQLKMRRWVRNVVSAKNGPIRKKF